MKWLASLGAWLPYFVDRQIKGMARWLTCKVRPGAAPTPTSEGSSLRSDTSRFEPAGKTAFQLLCLPYSAARIGMTATGGSVVFGFAPGEVDADARSRRRRKKATRCHAHARASGRPA